MASLPHSDWDTWKHIPTMELWQAVALSVGVEPTDEALRLLQGRLTDRDRADRSVRAEFQRRLRIAQANVSMDGPLVPRRLFVGALESPRTEVVFVQFAAWARSLPFEPLPDDFPGGDTNAGATLWPWGGHTTELLGHLAEAGRRFWTNYDPADSGTAPTNATVVEWLQARGVAQRTAEVMASMLRADGLPAGPRR